MEITEKSFWEIFWAKIKLPQTVDYNFKNDRVIAETIKKYIPKCNFDKNVLEIGCAPGKWLVMFNKELNYKICGFEYCEPAYYKTLENLEMNGIGKNVTDIKLIDFLNIEFKKTYDIVVSLGFIEHFENVENIFNKHVQLLHDQSYLIIGVPNFKGLNYFIQSLIDKHIQQKILPNHNLSVMNLKLLDSFATTNNLNKVFSGYIGGFEPSLFNTEIDNTVLRFLLRLLIKLSSIIFGNINNKIVSGYILTIYKY